METINQFYHHLVNNSSLNIIEPIIVSLANTGFINKPFPSLKSTGKYKHNKKSKRKLKTPLQHAIMVNSIHTPNIVKLLLFHGATYKLINRSIVMHDGQCLDISIKCEINTVYVFFQNNIKDAFHLFHHDYFKKLFVLFVNDKCNLPTCAANLVISYCVDTNKNMGFIDFFEFPEHRVIFDWIAPLNIEYYQTQPNFEVERLTNFLKNFIDLLIVNEVSNKPMMFAKKYCTSQSKENCVCVYCKYCILSVRTIFPKLVCMYDIMRTQELKKLILKMCGYIIESGVNCNSSGKLYNGQTEKNININYNHIDKKYVLHFLEEKYFYP